MNFIDTTALFAFEFSVECTASEIWFFYHGNQSMGLGQNCIKSGAEHFKSWHTFYRKRMSMLTDLEVWSLVRKSIFYRPEHLERGGSPGIETLVLKMQKWNISKNRAPRVDNRNGVICLVMFTPRVMFIKMWKDVDFLYFLLMTVKNRSQFGQNMYIWMVLISSFRKRYGLSGSELPLGSCQPLKKYRISGFFSTLLHL